MFIYRLSATYLSKKSNFSPKGIILGIDYFELLDFKKRIISYQHIHITKSI